MTDLTLQELDDESFESAFQACGDSDPLGLCLDGEVIGLATVRYNSGALAKLEQLGVRVVTA